MAEAPKTIKAPAPKGAAGKPAPKGPNPIMPLIAILLILGGAAWLAYDIATAPPPKKKPGGHGGH